MDGSELGEVCHCRLNVTVKEVNWMKSVTRLNVTGEGVNWVKSVTVGSR